MKEILTIAIGILILLMLLSILVSGLVNLITGMLNQKALKLDLALRNMLAASDVHETVYQAFKDHSLYRLQVQHPNRKRSLPSELKPEDFQIILMDVVCQGQPVNSPEEMMNFIEQLPDPDLKIVLRSLFRDANNDINMFKAGIMRWYQTILELAEGWQDQAERRFSMALALLVAIAFNVDVVHIFDRLGSDPAELQQIMTLANQLNLQSGQIDLGTFDSGGTGSFPPPGSAESSGFPPPGSAESSGFPPPGSAESSSFPPPAAAAGQTTQPSSTQEELQQVVDSELKRKRSPFGLGWREVDLNRMTIMGWLRKLLGWGVAVLGIGLGAPTLTNVGKKIAMIMARWASGKAPGHRMGPR